MVVAIIVALQHLFLEELGATDPDALAGIQAQLVGSSGATLTDGSIVIFDAPLSNSSNITYSAIIGLFTVTASDNYYIFWWVSTDGDSASTFVQFTLQSPPFSINSISPIVTGQTSGSTILSLTAQTTTSLINTTGDTIQFAAIPTQANIVIVQTS